METTKDSDSQLHKTAAAKASEHSSKVASSCSVEMKSCLSIRNRHYTSMEHLFFSLSFLMALPQLLYLSVSRLLYGDHAKNKRAFFFLLHIKWYGVVTLKGYF